MSTVSFSGLTGFDFGSMADALIELERVPIDQLELKKEKATSRKAMLTEIQNALSSLKTAALNLAKPNSISFVKTTSGNADRLTAAATSKAAVGTYQVTVEQLATGTRAVSGFATQLGIASSANLAANLNEPAANLGGGFTGGYITINGQRIDVAVDATDASNPATNDSLQEVIDKINTQLGAGFARYDAATDKLVLTSSEPITVGAAGDTSNFLQKTGLTSSPDLLNGASHERWTNHRLGRVSTTAALDQVTFGTALTGSGSFKINGIAIAYDATTDSINDVLSRINTKVTNVVASYDAQTDKVMLASKETGSLGITREDVSGNFLGALGLLDQTGESRAAVTLGQNAKVSIPGFNDGQPIWSTSNTVTNAIPGVTLTLKQADLGQPVEISVARDATDLKGKLSEFVTKFNEAMSLVRTRLTEEPIKDASSAATRRVGMLRGDSMLSRLRSNLTVAVTDVLGSLPTDYNRLGNLGVTVSKDGTLAFDEAKFTEKFEANFQQSYEILFQDLDGDGTLDDGEGGMVSRLIGKLDQIIETKTKDYNGTSVPLGDIARRNWSYDQDVKSIDSRIEALELAIELKEKTLRAKFLAAEKAISQLQGTTINVLDTKR